MENVFQYDFVVLNEGAQVPVATTGYVNTAGYGSVGGAAGTAQTGFITTTGNGGAWGGNNYYTVTVPPISYNTYSWPYYNEYHHYHWFPMYVWADEAFTKTKELFSTSSNFPPVNAFQQSDGSLLLEFAFAGYKKEDIALNFEGDTLILSSEGHDRPDYEKAREIRRGIKLSKFNIEYKLAPDHFETGLTKAKFEDGILSITIPLSESKKPKSVEIE